MSDTVYYAIGDVHGEDEKLARLHDFIQEDALRIGAAYFIVHVGDLIDRGPDSRGVVERVMCLERAKGAAAVTLLGNHEQMFLNAFDSSSAARYGTWSTNGGDNGLLSYERTNGRHGDWREAIDRAHVQWLRQLPTIWRDEARKIAFVHAGIDPWRFPNCSDEVRIWTRSRTFFESDAWPDRTELEGLLVVHGHTPTEDYEPDVSRRRINVDTGACFGGPLTCAVLAPGDAPRFLCA